MKYLILAAGIGKRLQPLTNQIPKCLLEINGRAVIEYILSAIDPNNKIKKFIVVGTDGNCWNKNVIKKLKFYPLCLIYNNKNIELDNAYSLYLGLKVIGEGPVVVIDGDIIFTHQIFQKLINSKYENAILSRPISGIDEKGGRVFIENDNRVIKISEQLYSDNAYIYAGIFKIGSNLNNYLQGSLDRYKKVIESINEASKTFNIFNISFEKLNLWININDIDNLIKAKLFYEKK
jgi:L-glutamine-phosphate cytidylyltransferase